MARPLRMAMLVHLASLCDSLDLLPTGDREDKATAYALHFLAGGHPPDRLPTLQSLALHLTSLGTEVSRPMVSNFIQNEDTDRGKQRRELYKRVKLESAASLVDGAMQKLEEAQPHEHSLAKAQAGVRQWVAERLDRETWGQQSTQVQGNQSMHLHYHAALTPPLPQIAPPLLGPIGTVGERGTLQQGEIVIVPSTTQEG